MNAHESEEISEDCFPNFAQKANLSQLAQTLPYGNEGSRRAPLTILLRPGT
ncbi:hypothetical protein CCP2SC5_310034 [Azospirillaceae bacterium]